MSDEVVEQITKNPLPENKSATKDPKKVAAGKKLAEYNKKAKEALAREMKRETEKSSEEDQSKVWMPELSFTTVLSIIGIGFTAVDMFMRYYKNRTEVVPTKGSEPPPSKIPVPKETTNNKIGM